MEGHTKPKRSSSRNKQQSEVHDKKWRGDSLIHFRERFFGDSYMLCKSKQDEKSIVFRSVNDESTQSFTVWKHKRCQRNPKLYNYVENLGTPVTKDHTSYFLLQCMKIGMIRALSDFDGAVAGTADAKYIIDTVMPIDDDVAETHLQPRRSALRSAFSCFGSYMNLCQHDFSTKVVASRAAESVGEGNRIRLRFHFVSHACGVYSDIRSVLGYTVKPIMEELAGDDWSSTPTPGKSTALLFFCGPKWVLKTVDAAEVNFLRRQLLPEYRSHFARFPETLLPHFLGHFTLAIKSGFGGFRQEISFVLMRNMVPVPHGLACERYDLKGSLVDRSTPAGRTGRVLKDLDLRCRIHVVNEAVRKKVLTQCREDVRFLERMCIMDYSLLLGIVRVEGSAGCEIVVGLVDILQTYTFHKRLERFFKGIVYDRRLISCAPPKEYGERFLRFFESIFV